MAYYKGWQEQLSPKLENPRHGRPRSEKVQRPYRDALAAATRTRNSRRRCDYSTQHPESELGLAEEGDGQGQGAKLHVINQGGKGSGQEKPVLHGKRGRPNQALEIQFARAVAGAANAVRVADREEHGCP